MRSQTRVSSNRVVHSNAIVVNLDGRVLRIAHAARITKSWPTVDDHWILMSAVIKTMARFLLQTSGLLGSVEPFACSWTTRTTSFTDEGCHDSRSATDMLSIMFRRIRSR